MFLIELNNAAVALIVNYFFLAYQVIVDNNIIIVLNQSVTFRRII